MKPRFVIQALFLFALSACSGTSNVIEPTPLEDFESKLSVKEVWDRSIGGVEADKLLKIQPYVDSGNVYTSDEQGLVKAVKLDDGSDIWSVDLNVDITGGVGFGDDKLYVCTRKGVVIAMDAGSGKVLWRHQVSSQVLAPPVYGRDSVIVQTIDGKLFGLSADSGRELWSYARRKPALSLRGTSKPLVFQNIIITGFADGVMAAFNIKNGRLLWETPVALPTGKNEVERLVDVDVTPLIYEYTLYIASYQGKLVAVNLRKGKTLWSKDISTYTGMAVDNNGLYVTDEDGNLLAFDRRTGASLWSQKSLYGRRPNAPVMFGGYVVVGDYEGYLHWFSPKDGKVVGRNHVGPDPIRTQALVEGDRLLVASGGTLAVLALR